ncbi:MAG TPA: MFS transporter [Phycisphaerae bacterium]|nr:MFS transporter [Phycisphaerae bacterium]
MVSGLDNAGPSVDAASGRAGADAPKLGWRFPGCFWIANIAELFERAAFYGMFIALAIYLTQEVKFTDVETGWVIAVFTFLLYLMPPFMGALADALGFRAALMAAFASLTAGYVLLGAMQHKWSACLALAFIAGGGAIVKPVILGTTAKCSDELNRARAFSIFYFMVNVGAFLGKTIAAPLRTGFNFPGIGHLEFGLVYINYYAAAMAFCALILVAIAYRSPDTAGTGKTIGELVQGFVRVLSNGRFMALILIVAGFWLIQGQLYASMPKYMIRLLGESAKPEWLANINPFVVVLCVVPITHLVRTFKPQNSIGIALTIIPLSAICVAIAPLLQSKTGDSVSILGLFSLHPITLMVIIGIALQGFAECFLSPKFLEYASRQAPRGEEGLYMGFQNLSVALSWFVGFILSGYLLDAFCPDPTKLEQTNPAAFAQWKAAIERGGPMPEAYASAHVIWYVFAAVGVAALMALMIFNRVTSRADRMRETIEG